MALRSLSRNHFRLNLRALGLAGLLVAATVAACGKIEDLTGPSKDSGKITITPAAASTPPSTQFGFSISAVDKDGKPAADGTVLVLKGDSLGTVTPASIILTGGKADAQFTAGAVEGTSTITAIGLNSKKTATVTISKSAAPPPPNAPSTGDAINFSTVRWVGLGGSVADYTWRSGINLKINSINNAAKPTICWSSNNPSDWPVDRRAGVTIGNLWGIIKHTDGNWYGAPIEWIIKAQGPSACTTMENIPPQPPFIQGKAPPVATHYPRSGEQIGFMITSLPAPFSAPANIPKERSSIVFGTYP